jgi:hypothetical protein
MSAAAASARVELDELVREILKRREDLCQRGVPDSYDAKDLSEAGEIGEFQRQCADELLERGLDLKSRRRRLCRRVGSRWYCSDTTCGRLYYTAFSCRVRYCPECGPRMFRELHRKYAGLAPEAKLRREIRVMCSRSST